MEWLSWLQTSWWVSETKYTRETLDHHGARSSEQHAAGFIFAHAHRQFPLSVTEQPAFMGLSWCSSGSLQKQEVAMCASIWSLSHQCYSMAAALQLHSARTWPWMFNIFECAHLKLR